jgi:hypothetical protein
MSLPVPVVGSESGPDFAYDINSSLALIDSHDHTPGKGVQLTSGSLNINANLSFNGFQAINVGAVTLAPQSVTPPGGSLYESGVDLFYVDGLGNNIQITESGGIAGTPGSITGLVPPASVTYVAASRTFVFASDSTISANLDAASILMRNITPNSTFAVTLQPPASLSSNYSITLPTLPAQKNFVTMDTSGILAADSNVDNVTLQYSTDTLSVKNAGISTAQIANGSVTGVKLDTSAISTLKFQDFNTPGSSSFVVPARISMIMAQIIGGGGGGAGGARNAANSSQGGSGGGGSVPLTAPIKVIPGETLTVIVGGGGAGGNGSATSGQPGANGSQGSSSIIVRASNGIELFLAAGGLPGLNTGSASGSSWTPTASNSSGGSSPLTGAGGAGPISSFCLASSAGGASVNTGAGGGGGGAGWLGDLTSGVNPIGGAGGQGNNNSPGGLTGGAPVGYGAGGGGGGGGSSNSGAGGGAGHAGNGGFVRIIWTDIP